MKNIHILRNMIVKGEKPLSKFQGTGGAIRLYGVLISNRGTVSASLMILMICSLFYFFCRVSKLNTVGLSYVLSEPAVTYFTDSEVRHWQANDTSLGATPKPPRKEAKAI